MCIKIKCIKNASIIDKKSRCKDCGGVGICKHGRQKPRCKECGGSRICQHNREKYLCKDCGGNGFCEHDDRRISTCKECGGSQICEHNKRKSNCKDCSGSARCQEHNKIKNRCKDCFFQTYLINLQIKSIKRLFKKPNIKTVNRTIKYLGCDSDFFIKFFQSKMVDGMTFENIHIDHIKPISKFDFEHHEEFLKCCHYSNLQPLLAIDNMNKFNKWTDDDEIFWNENIIYKNYTKLYF